MFSSPWSTVCAATARPRPPAAPPPNYPFVYRPHLADRLINCNIATCVQFACLKRGTPWHSRPDAVSVPAAATKSADPASVAPFLLSVALDHATQPLHHAFYAAAAPVGSGKWGLDRVVGQARDPAVSLRGRLDMAGSLPRQRIGARPRCRGLAGTAHQTRCRSPPLTVLVPVCPSLGCRRMPSSPWACPRYRMWVVGALQRSHAAPLRCSAFHPIALPKLWRSDAFSA